MVLEKEREKKERKKKAGVVGVVEINTLTGIRLGHPSRRHPFREQQSQPSVPATLTRLRDIRFSYPSVTSVSATSV